MRFCLIVFRSDCFLLRLSCFFLGELAVVCYSVAVEWNDMMLSFDCSLDEEIESGLVVRRLIASSRRVVSVCII